MWPICNLGLSSFLWLLIPLLLGLLTGWWIWANRRTDADLAYAAPAAEPVRPIPPAPAPVAVAPVAAAPVAAAPVMARDTGGVDAGTVGLGVGALGAGAVALTAIGIPAAVGAADDLTLIKGIGPKLNGVLNGLGVHRFDQIAAWTAGDVDKVDDHLGEFKDRIGREEWIPQAKLLAAGNKTEFNRLYGPVARAGAVAAAGAGAVAMTAIGIPAAVGDPDDLLQIKGVGPKLNALLNSLGITRFDQIAKWGTSEVSKVDTHLGNFSGRIVRDSWVEQAGLLARGAIADF
jgi:predicted flap endonuclease-1-like 5' DNA nuclease